MARYKPAGKKEKKVMLNVTVSPSLVKWIDMQVQNRVFASRSHAVEQALFFLMNFQKSYEKKIEKMGLEGKDEMNFITD